MPIEFPSLELGTLVPFWLLLGTGILVLLLDLFVDRKSPLAYVALIGLIVSAVSLLPYWGTARTVLSVISIDSFFVFFGVVSIGSAILTVLISLHYTAEEGSQIGEYYPLLVFTTFGMVLLVAASDLIVVFLAIELLSIGLYVLTGLARSRPTALEASFKYFLLGSFSLGFLVYGTALLFGATGTTGFSGIATALSRPGVLSNPLVVIGGGLILVGFAFKLAFVPFHMWTPDVYSGAPTPITAFMSVGTKAATFAALLRLVLGGLPALQTNWASIFWVLALLTMVWGNIAAVVQSDIKRMLGYSSVAQAGYVLVGVVAATQQGLVGVSFYLLVYLVMNIGAFGVVAALARRGEVRSDVSSFAGLATRSPWLAGAMALFMLSLAGVPPTAGFMGKLYVFGSAVQAGYTDLAIVGVLTSAVSAFYYLGVIVTMYMRQPAEGSLPVRVPAPLALALLITAVLTLGLGIYPSPAVSAAQSMTSQKLVTLR